MQRHSFVLRIWREEEGGRWQGWIQHTRSGAFVHIRSTQELLAFLQRFAGELGPPLPSPPPPEEDPPAP